jgi:hypothetical protein
MMWGSALMGLENCMSRTFTRKCGDPTGFVRIIQHLAPSRTADVGISFDAVAELRILSTSEGRDYSSSL